MKNHKWNDNTCVKCGVKRKKHYLREMIWLFSFDELKWKEERPDCKIISVNPSVSKSLVLFGVKCKDKKNAKEFVRMMATGGW